MQENQDFKPSPYSRRTILIIHTAVNRKEQIRWDEIVGLESLSKYAVPLPLPKRRLSGAEDDQEVKVKRVKGKGKAGVVREDAEEEAADGSAEVRSKRVKGKGKGPIGSDDAEEAGQYGGDGGRIKEEPMDEDERKVCSFSM